MRGHAGQEMRERGFEEMRRVDNVGRGVVDRVVVSANEQRRIRHDQLWNSPRNIAMNDIHYEQRARSFDRDHRRDYHEKQQRHRSFDERQLAPRQLDEGRTGHRGYGSDSEQVFNKFDSRSTTRTSTNRWKSITRKTMFSKME